MTRLQAGVKNLPHGFEPGLDIVAQKKRRELLPDRGLVCQVTANGESNIYYQQTAS